MRRFQPIPWLVLPLILCAHPSLAGTAVHSGGRAMNVLPKQQKQQAEIDHGALRISFRAGIEAGTGDTTMQIGYPVTWADGSSESGPFPVSELIYPLDAFYASFGLHAEIKSRFLLDLSLSTNISDPDDHLIDQDWITPWNQGIADIYSESEITSFDALLWSGDISYKLLTGSQGWLAAGMGYSYQDFDYEARLLRQWSPSGLSGFDAVGSGVTALTYSLTYTMPYFLVQGHLDVTPAFSLGARLAYSPWVSADDTDNHLLRDKENNGDLDGDSWSISLDGTYAITPNWFVDGGFRYTSIEVDGTSSATFSGVYNHTVREEIETSETFFFVQAGYRF